MELELIPVYTGFWDGPGERVKMHLPGSYQSANRSSTTCNFNGICSHTFSDLPAIVLSYNLVFYSPQTPPNSLIWCSQNVFFIGDRQAKNSHLIN